MNVTATIKNWKLEQIGDSYVIYGNIENDNKERFDNNNYIRTSKLKSIDFDNNIAYTMNSVYRLEV